MKASNLEEKISIDPLGRSEENNPKTFINRKEKNECLRCGRLLKPEWTCCPGCGKNIILIGEV